MSDLNITCTIAGGPEVSLESLSLALGVINLSNMQNDTAALTWTRPDGRVSLGTLCPIAHDDTVDIWINGVRKFRGRARIGKLSRASIPITLEGPWSYFERTPWQTFNLNSGDLFMGVPVIGETFRQYYAGMPVWNGTTWVNHTGWITWTVGSTTAIDFSEPVAPGEDRTGTLDASLAWTSRQWLFEGFAPVSLQITGLMAYFSRIYSGAPPVAEGIQELGDLLRTRPRTVQDIRLAEAIRQTLQAKPDASVWIDYSVEPPSLNMRVASLEEARVLHVTSPEVIDWPVTIHDDLRLRGVFLRWEHEPSPFTGQGTLLWLHKWPLSGVVTYEEDVLVQTISGTGFDSVNFLTKQLYDTLNVRRSSGSLLMDDPTFSRGWRPGSTLYLEGDAMMEGVQHLVQGVSWSPGTGQTTLTVGYPRHLSLNDRLDLQRVLREIWYPMRWNTQQVIP